MTPQATAVSQGPWIALLKEQFLHLPDGSTTFPGGIPVTFLHMTLAGRV